MRSTSEQILFELKTRGAAATHDLAGRVGITRQAAREHLRRLATAQLVEHTRSRSGVGRPGHRWSLTEKGHGRFPDTHAQMTVELIEAIQGEFGDAGLERMVARRERGMAERYSETLRGADTLEDRVTRLVQLRSAEGYMAESFRRDDGTYVIIENHCPICAAATTCQGFCRSELALFAQLLAPAQVERSEHLLTGGQRCSYVVAPTAGG